MEWTIPAFTPQPQSITALWLVLISRPAEGRRLRWPGAVHIPPPRHVLPVSRYGYRSGSLSWSPPKFNHLFTGHCQPFPKILCKSVRKFLRKVANRQTDKQRRLHILHGGGNEQEAQLWHKKRATLLCDRLLWCDINMARVGSAQRMLRLCMDYTTS